MRLASSIESAVSITMANIFSLIPFRPGEFVDRIYAQDQNSQIVWHSHELDNEHAKRIESDHIPVIVEAAPLGEPKSQKATSKSRINTDILYEQETRREILKILRHGKIHMGNIQRTRI